MLSEVLGGDSAVLPGIHGSVTTAYLDYDPDTRKIHLRMYPADTLQQARTFYGRPNAIKRILVLQKDGWKVTPNFHFGFMAKGFCWTKTDLSIAEYLAYWQQAISNTTQIDRPEWYKYWSLLTKAKIVSLADREEFDRHFTSTTRQSASPRPGIRCELTWTLEEAELLDAQGKMQKLCRERLNQALAALGEAEI